MPDTTSTSTSTGTKKGRLFVISAPSGTGKSTITSALQEQGLIRVSVSHTTREPRQAEQDGIHYFFVSRETFIEMRDRGKFLEWTEVFDHFYGTPAKWIELRLQEGQNIMLELDVKGALQVKEHHPAAVMIFIRPPSLDTLATRLQKRGANSPESTARRLAAAEAEIAQSGKYDHVIINDDLAQALNKVRDIILNTSSTSDEPSSSDTTAA